MNALTVKFDAQVNSTGCEARGIDDVSLASLSLGGALPEFAGLSSKIHNRHRARRLRTFKGGKIIFQSPLLPYPTIMNCVIRDITEAGARFTCESHLSLPKELGLIWTSANQMRDVRVVWIRDLDVGVEFTSGPRQAGLR